MPDTLRIDRMPMTRYAELIASTPVILPIGATEQHGPHLPLGTDALCVTAIADLVGAASGALVAPTLSYGSRSVPRSGGGEEFPGTTGLSLNTVVANLTELLDQFADDGARHVCVLSGHYENTAAIHEASFQVTARRTDLKVVTVLWPDLLTPQTLRKVYPEDLEYPGLDLEHAAFLETSVMMHLYPDLVDLDLAPSAGLAAFPPYDVYPTPAGLVPSSGCLAPSTGSSADAGKAIISECVTGIASVITNELGQ
ncbi:creatininase [Streptomyces fuscichromogenes]|uniref:creatininase n=1 Tax=Streptomyces fuscichromogenes TaxID=1324013 RepID=UPI00380D77E4